MGFIGAAVTSIFGAGVIGQTIAAFATSYATSAITNALFGQKQGSNSPTYSIGALQTQTNSNMVMPIIYGRVKCAGNNLWQDGSGTTVQRLVGFGLGKNKGVSDVRLDDLLVNTSAIFKIYNSLYLDAKISKMDHNHRTTLSLYCNGSMEQKTFETNTTVEEFVDYIKDRSANGWVVTDYMKVSNIIWDVDSFELVDCYNKPANFILPGISSCSYTAYMGDGVQQIDSRVTGDTQEAKARLVGGMKYDAYLALTITASDKISSNPNVTAVWDGRIVKIYSKTALDGYTLDLKTGYFFKEEWSDNVWCILDFLTGWYGCNIPITDIDIQSFITASEYAQPADGKRRWSINLILDEKKSRQDWLNEMQLCFRAWRTYQNGKHGILIEKPEPVSQIFKVKKTESIRHDWQELAKDYERIIVKYIDPDYEWQKVGAPATIKPPFRNATYDDNGNLLTNGTPLTKTIEINGITNFKQASQHAWFLVNQAQTCQDIITYECNKRALNRTIGDVVGIWDHITQLHEPGLEYKRYRIIAMTEPQGMKITLVMIEYNEALYTDAQGSISPVVNVTKLPNPINTPPDVTNLTLDQTYYRMGDGTIVSDIIGSCTLPDYSYFGTAQVQWSNDNGQIWHDGGMTNSSGGFVIHNAVTGVNYLIKVTVKSKGLGISSKGVISDPLYVTGKDNPPSNVGSLTAKLDPTDRRKIILSWPAVTDIDLNGYRLLESGNIITPTPISDTQYVFTATEDRQHNFSIVAIDNSGNPSEIPAMTSITPVIYPAIPTGFNAIQNGENILLVWDENSASDVSGFELRYGPTFDSGALLITGLTSTTYEFPADSEGVKRYHIKSINAAGNYSKQAATAEETVKSLPPKNVIFTIDEIEAKSGTHNNTEFGKTTVTCISLPGYCVDYQGYTCDQFGLMGVFKLAQNASGYYPSGVYQTAIKDMGDIITARISCNFASPNILLNSGITAKLEFRTSTNGETWSIWKPFMPATLTFQYVQFQVLFETADSLKTPEVGQFIDSVDVPDQEEEGIIQVPIGGTNIVFKNKYHSIPVFTPTAIGTGLHGEVASVSITGANGIKVLNRINADADVGGQLHYRVKGW